MYLYGNKYEPSSLPVGNVPLGHHHHHGGGGFGPGYFNLYPPEPSVIIIEDPDTRKEYIKKVKQQASMGDVSIASIGLNVVWFGVGYHAYKTGKKKLGLGLMISSAIFGVMNASR